MIFAMISQRHNDGHRKATTFGRSTNGEDLLINGVPGRSR